MSTKPTDAHVRVARDAVSLVLRDQEAAWGPVASLLAKEFPNLKEGGHHAPDEKAGCLKTHNAGGADVVNNGGAAGNARAVERGLAAALAAYEEQHSKTAMMDFLRGYLGCVLY